MINVYEDILSHPEYFKQLNLKEFILVNYQCPQIEQWVDLYSHFNHIIYTVNGKKILNTPGKTYVLEEGNLIFLKKGAIRQGRFFDSKWVVIVFCMPDTYLQQLLREYRANVPVAGMPPPTTDSVIELKATNTTHSFFYSLLPYFTQQQPTPDALLELKCRELMFNIFSNPENTGFLSYLNSVSDLTKPTLSQVMEANYTYNLSLEEFARVSQRSLTAFKNEFAETFNTTPGKWLVRRRLEYAAMLLSVSEKNINEIVYECGFESTTHFSRVFKSKFGMSPLQYRKHSEVSAKAEA